MCGIVGTLVFNNSDFKITEDYLNTMRDAMFHRGPDDAGEWISLDKKMGLGHRRLSIIDLSKLASQPMHNEKNNLSIVFNGEIYNHAEIRKELISKGKYKWKTDHSDTEVILHAFEEWGIDCVDHFRGMFAIAVYDLTKRELWLIRDRLGVKPIYYSIHNGRLTFASEIKAILKDPMQKRKINEEAFFHYLSFLTTPAPQTLFDGIKKLSPGSWIKVNENGEIKEQVYWDVLDHTVSKKNLTEEEISNEIIQELRTSVKLRKESDVPVGVFLSGGIDSSTNAALFSEGESKNVKTFCIGYDKEYGTSINETGFAKLMAAEIGADYHERLLNVDDLIEFLPKMVKLQDEPIADPVCMPLYYVAKLAKDNGVTVCQVGEGADELFCGYEGWKRSINLQKLNDSFPFQRLKKILVKILSVLPYVKDSFQLEWLKRASESHPIFWGGAEAFSDIHKRRLLSPRLRKKFSKLSSWKVIEPIRSRFEKKFSEKSTLNWMTYLDLNLRLPELLLMRVDKMSMGVSLEGRVPFLDHKFVELAMSIPEDVKTKNKTLKYILKKSVREIIPDLLIDRKKQGFSIPIHEWFLGSFGDYAKKELIEFCDNTDFLDKKEVISLMNKERGAQVWYLLNFALWWKEYIK
jgi:asparagine synthase (glutamine-hydrolysing)